MTPGARRRGAGIITVRSCIARRRITRLVRPCTVRRRHVPHRALPPVRQAAEAVAMAVAADAASLGQGGLSVTYHVDVYRRDIETSDEEHVFHTDITFVRVDESGNKLALRGGDKS